VAGRIIKTVKSAGAIELEMETEKEVVAVA